MSARYHEAIEGVRRGLTLLDRQLPKADLQAAIQVEFEQIQAALGDTPVSELVDRPTMSDPVVCSAVRLLLSGFSAAFFVDPVLYSLMILRSVNLSLRHGHPPEAMDLYSYYGHLLTGLFNKPREGYEFGALAVKLSDKMGNLQDKCRSSFILANFIHAWVEPLPEAIQINNAGFDAGRESGELQFAGYILFHKGLCDFYCGKQLSTLREETNESLSFNHKVRDTVTRDATQGLALALANVAGMTSRPDVFETETNAEAAYIADCQANQTTNGLCYYNILKTQVLGLHGEHEQAIAASEAAEGLLDSIMGNVAVAEHAYHTALSLAAVYPGTAKSKQKSIWTRLEGHCKKLSEWAEICPSNFAHMHALVKAEMARCRGEAVDAFEEAVELAKATGFQQDLARANELAGRYWLARGRDRLGRVYLSEAYLGYRTWEAGHKLAALEEEYSWISSPTGSGHVEGERSGQLDLASVIKASQAISGEIVLERLLRQLIRLMVENAGAQRGVLVIDADGTLQVEATAALVSVDGPQELDIEVRQGTPLAAYDQISHSVVDYAVRTADSVILNDALGEGRFTRDTYILEARPRSVLCVPLSGHGRMVGFLYLENNLITGAFTPEHLEVLRLLSSQFVISFENARLYEEMERKVLARTEELSQKTKAVEEALRNLRTTQDQLIHSEKMTSLGQLTAGVAHEINNPLNFVNNFARLGGQIVDELVESKEADPDVRVSDVGDLLADLKTNVESIQKHGQRATAIVVSMLLHARGSKGEREVVDLNDFVREYIELAKFGAGTSGDETRVSVSFRFDEAAGNVEIQRQEFGQVLVNLLNNAFVAVRERHRTEPAAFDGVVEVSTHRENGWVEVRVSDNGVGVPEEIRDKIFQPFFTTKPGKEGTGLGLSLTYEIVVHGHGGKLRIESPPGRGSVFIASLPATAV